LEYSAKEQKIERIPTMNYLVISGLKGGVLDPVVEMQQKRTMIDPLTGKISSGQVLGDAVLKDILARPLVEERDLVEFENDVENEALRSYEYELKEHEQEIISEGEKKHRYNIDFRVVEGFNEFKEELKKPIESGSIDKIFLFMHGHPERLGPKPGVRITAEELKNIPSEERKEIQLNLKSSSSCTAISCSIFGNIEDPKKDNVGIELAKLIGAEEFTGSRYIVYTFKQGTKSADFIKVSPIKDSEDVKISGVNK